MTTLRIEVTTIVPSLRKELLGDESGRGTPGRPISAGGWDLVEDEPPKKGAFGLAETFSFLLSLGTGVASGVLANWLYDKLQGRCSRLWIEGRDTVVGVPQIEQAVQQERGEKAKTV